MKKEISQSPASINNIEAPKKGKKLLTEEKQSNSKAGVFSEVLEDKAVSK